MALTSFYPNRYKRTLAAWQIWFLSLKSSAGEKFVPLCRLAAPNQKLMVQRDELVAADWHPLEAVENMPIFQSGPLFQSIFACCKAYAEGSYPGLQALQLAHGRLQRTDLLFSK